MMQHALAALSSLRKEVATSQSAEPLHVGRRLLTQRMDMEMHTARRNRREPIHKADRLRRHENNPLAKSHEKNLRRLISPCTNTNAQGVA